jgi:hypothetical protein
LQGERIMRHPKFAAASTLGLVLMLAAASPALAGISNFATDRDATLAPGGLQMSVNGTVKCPINEAVFVTVQVVQFEHGQLVASASGNTATGFVACTGDVQPWEVTAISNIPMHPGPASASATAFAFFPFENAAASAELLLGPTP